MAGKNRTTSLIVELVVIAAIVAGFMYVGSDYLRMNREKSELNANIDSLQQEINRMREEEELSAAAIVEKEGKLAEMYVNSWKIGFWKGRRTIRSRI